MAFPSPLCVTTSTWNRKWSSSFLHSTTLCVAVTCLFVPSRPLLVLKTILLLCVLLQAFSLVFHHVTTISQDDRRGQCDERENMRTGKVVGEISERPDVG